MAQEIAPYMNKAKEKLLKVGFPESDISIKILDASRDTATEILKEARKKGFGTVVVGRRGATGTNDFTMGSVTRKIVHDSKGLSIWVVD